MKGCWIRFPEQSEFNSIVVAVKTSSNDWGAANSEYFNYDDDK